MKKYPKMKPSGVEWIRDVPEKWEVKKIKHTTYVKGRVGWKGLRSDEFLETGFAFLITGTDFKEGKVDWKNCYQISQDRYEEDPFIQLRENDLLITKDGTIGKLAVVENLNGFASLNSGIFVVRPLFDFYHSRFLYYFLSSKAFTEYVDFTKSGSTISHLYQNIFIEFKFCCPTLLEQERIISYLNRKTVQLDQTISEKERLIELFREERQAIINHAVTKGIRAGVKMKASGVEWIGDVPEEWVVKKNGYLCEIKRGAGYQYITEVFDNEDCEAVIRISDFNNFNPIFATKIPEFDKYRVSQNDILIAGTGASAGITLFATKEMDGMVHSYNALRLKVKGFNPKLLFYNFNSHSILEQMNLSFTGSAQHFLDVERIANFQVCVPPLEEQAAIVSYLDQKTAQIDTAISGIQQEITLLQEYRQALIFEAVTGKVDVRENT